MTLSIQADPDGNITGYTIGDEDDNVETYYPSGELASIRDRSGNVQTLNDELYQTVTYQGVVAQIHRVVTDNFGRTLSLDYAGGTGGTRLMSVTDPNGCQIDFIYGDPDFVQLSEVNPAVSDSSYCGAFTYIFNYSDPNWVYGISSIQTFGSQIALSYDSTGRVVSTTLSGASTSTSYQYDDDSLTTTITDPLGAVRTYSYTSIGGHRRILSLSGDPCIACGVGASTTYDTGGFPSSSTDFNGNVTTYVYNDTRGLLTDKTEAYGTNVAREQHIDWEANFKLPREIDDYSGGDEHNTLVKQTVLTHDPSTGALLSRSVTDVASGKTRAWTYSDLTATGQPQSIDGPRTDVQDVAHISYYQCSSPPSGTTGNPCGEIYQITDALGHVTTFNSYDGYGNPTLLARSKI